MKQNRDINNMKIMNETFIDQIYKKTWRQDNSMYRVLSIYSCAICKSIC